MVCWRIKPRLVPTFGYKLQTQESCLLLSVLLVASDRQVNAAVLQSGPLFRKSQLIVNWIDRSARSSLRSDYNR